ncbi:hypothetical protein PIB30_102072, partial [Stylosanthes scabra]|nr:hypothetical protein [Stylosanthes scabra]
MPIFFIGIYMHHHATTECNQLWLHIPFIVLGFFLLIVSFLGLLGACYRSTCLLWLYLFAMLLLVILVSSITIFAFIVRHNSAVSEAGSEEGYKVLGDHPNWLRNRVNDTSTWNRIKSCLQAGKFCSHAQSNFLGDTFNIFNHEKLLSAELCCKPSDECKFVNQRANVWIKGTNATYSNSDCDAWSNDSNILCYNCESCKVGLIEDLKNDLK